MEQQLFQFATNHAMLCLAFVGVLGLIGINELINKKRGPKTLSTAAAVECMNHEQAIVIDLRDKEAFRAGHIIGALNITADDLVRQTQHKTSPLILVCARGIQATTLASKLRKEGFTQPMVLTGGMTAWQTASLPMIKGKK